MIPSAALMLAIAAAQPAEILRELNELRADPPGYARKLEQRRRHFRGNTLYLPGKVPLRTIEGPTAVEEAIRVLRKTQPLPELTGSEALRDAARRHAADLGKSGSLSHQGSDGSTPAQRIRGQLPGAGIAGEVISFGPEEADQVVLDLLVDDGIRDRGHRKLLLDPRFRIAGAACAPHARYRTVCVIDLTALTE